jgi:hypothetical protein
MRFIDKRFRLPIVVGALIWVWWMFYLNGELATSFAHDVHERNAIGLLEDIAIALLSLGAWVGSVVLLKWLVQKMQRKAERHREGGQFK